MDKDQRRRAEREKERKEHKDRRDRDLDDKDPEHPTNRDLNTQHLAQKRKSARRAEDSITEQFRQGGEDSGNFGMPSSHDDKASKGL